MVAGNEIKTLTGGLNQDVDVRFLQSGQYIDALNVRVFSSDNGSDGVVENVKGNTKKNALSGGGFYTLPSGVNRCIGSVLDKVKNRVYSFIWNSQGSHVILSYNTETDTIDELVKDNDYSGATTYNPTSTSPISAGDVLESNVTSGEYYQARIGFTPNAYNASGGDTNITNRYLFEKVGDYLDFRQFDLIQGRVLNKDGNSLLFWTDLVNEEGNERVRFINVERALGELDNDYPDDLRKNYFDVAPDAPMYRPIVDADHNGAIKSNKIFNKYYQFKYRYIYREGQPSSWSPYSEIPRYNYNSLNLLGSYTNYIDVRVDRIDGFSSNSIVSKIEVAVRSCANGNSGSWYRIKTIDCDAELPTSESITTFGITDGAHKNPFYYEFRWVGGDDYTPYGTDEAGYDYCYIPQSAKAIEFINDNRLSLHNTIYGYDINDIDVSGLSTDPTQGAVADTFDYVAYRKTFKKGASYDVGIRYSDGKGRCTTVITSANATLEIPYTNNVGIDFNRQIWADVTIDHQPPSWAKTWQTVIRPASRISYEGSTPDFQQTTITGTTTLTALDTTYGAGNYHLYGIGTINVWDYDHQNNGNVTFDTSSQTMIRKYADYNGSSIVNPSSYLEAQNSGRYATSGQTYIMTLDATAIGAAKDTLEVYRPSDVNSALWYEMGSAFLVNIDTNGELVHAALNGSTNVDQVWGSTNATSIIKDADCYIGGFNFYSSTTYPAGATTGRTLEANTIMETAWIDPIYPSKSNDRGRPNVVSSSYGRYHTESRSHFSQPVVQESERTDFSLMYDADFVDNNNQYGEIQTVYQLNQNLYIFQELRVGYRPVARQIIEDLNSQQLVGVSGEIFGDVTYSPQEYGISKQPESFAVYGDAIFFTDINRAAVLRMRGIAIENISDKGIKTLLDDLASYASYFNHPFIHGEYDVEFDEYILSLDFNFTSYGSDWSSQTKTSSVFGFEPNSNNTSETWIRNIMNVSNNNINITPEVYSKDGSGVYQVFNGNLISEQSNDLTIEGISDTTGIDTTDYDNYVVVKLRGTLAFSNKVSLWSTRYSYEPDFLGRLNAKLLSFKYGELYLHNTNSTYNNFYGTQYSTSVKVPFNENPTQKKNYTSITLDSTDAMSAAIENKVGQASSLETTDFVEREDKFSSPILRDTNTPNKTYPLLDGDKLIDTNMSVELTTTKTTLFSLFQVIARYVISKV